MASYVEVAKVSEISDPGKLMLEVEERLVVLLQVGGKFFCIDDVCTHDGGPLAEGELCGHELACPRHGAKFDVRNGAALTMPATQDTVAHKVKVEGEAVLVQIKDD